MKNSSGEEYGVDDYQKESRIHRKKDTKKSHTVNENHTSFTKEAAKKNRKNSAKALSNQYKYSTDYDEYDDVEYDNFEKFGRR